MKTQILTPLLLLATTLPTASALPTNELQSLSARESTADSPLPIERRKGRDQGRSGRRRGSRSGSRGGSFSSGVSHLGSSSSSFFGSGLHRILPSYFSSGSPKSPSESRSDDHSRHSNERRKGGGGGRSGGSSGGSSSSGSSSSGSSSSSSSGSRSGSSNTGGSSAGGSGVAPAYGGRYAGGAASPYSSGARSGSIVPYLLVGGALGAGAGLYAGSHFSNGAYSYPYTAPVTFYNQTSMRNETHPITCLCGRYQECGCDDNTDPAYIESVVGNGSYAAQMAPGSTWQANNNGTIYIDGTLDNGTTASGGTNAAGGRRSIMEVAGWWAVAAAVGCAMWSV